MNKIIVWGGTGNYKVVKEIIESNSQQIIAIFDNNASLKNPFPEIPFIGGKDSFPQWINNQDASELNCVVAIGGKYGRDRIEIQNFLCQYGVKPLTIQHRTSYVSPTAILGEGTQVYAMASVCTEVETGKACIINTSASIDHECILGDGVFIGPGAKLAGSINVGDFADIYTGAIVLPRLKIGKAAVVGAGSVVIEDVPAYTVVAGNPAKIIKEIKR